MATGKKTKKKTGDVAASAPADDQQGAEGSASDTAKIKAAEALKKEQPLVDDHAEAFGVPAWELAGLMRAANWREGKRVTKAEFETMLKKFRKRPVGGGRINQKEA